MLRDSGTAVVTRFVRPLLAAVAVLRAGVTVRLAADAVRAFIVEG